MRALFIAAALAAIPLAVPAVAQEAPAASRISDADRAALAEAERRGTLLYAYDQAAWHGTDAFLAQASDEQKAQVGGWVVQGTAQAPVFVLLARDSPRARFIARFDGSKIVSARLIDAGDPDGTLGAEALGLIRAREIATSHFAVNLPGRCGSAPFNSVIVPPAKKGDATSVYLLTPQVDLKVLPIGGHFRIDVEANGTPGTVRRFTDNCEDHDIPAPGPRGMLVVAAPDDSVPTEIHVFSSLTSHRPMLVTTAGGKRRWRVEAGRITPIP